MTVAYERESVERENEEPQGGVVCEAETERVCEPEREKCERRENVEVETEKQREPSEVAHENALQKEEEKRSTESGFLMGAEQTLWKKSTTRGCIKHTRMRENA